MTDANAESRSKPQISRTYALIIPAILSLCLLALLFPIPGPDLHVNQPFKAELLLSAFAILLLVIRSRKNSAGIVSKAYDPRPVRTISIIVGGFVLWSALSIFWARSVGSAVHHTLLWGLYLIIFTIFIERIRHDAGIRAIIAVFLIVSLVLGVLSIFDYLSAPDLAAAEGAIRARYGKYAEMLVTLLPLLWAAAIYAKARRRMIVVLIAAIVGWVAVMLSLSKGALISGVIGFVIFFTGAIFFSRIGFRKRAAYAAAAWLILTVGFQILFSTFAIAPTTTDLLTGKADPDRASTSLRLFFWKVGRQMAADHWLIGVGADNFGLVFNEARRRYHAANPDDLSPEAAEDLLVERAHNETLQVFAELGVVGLILFSLPLVTFAFYFLKKLRSSQYRSSPILWTSFAGVVSFIISSQVSSFSFRAAQNGVVLVLVLAVAVNELSKAKRLSPKRKTEVRLSGKMVIFSWLCSLFLFAFCLTRAYAEYQLYCAEEAASLGESQPYYRNAVTADPGYAGAYLSNASRTSQTGDAAQAVTLWRKAIDNGIETTQIYDLLAKDQFRAGDATGAEQTYTEAVGVYPCSVYIRTAFAVFLEDQGKPAEAAEQLDVARSIDERQVNGWYALIRKGSLAAFELSRTDGRVAPPAELVPNSAVIQYLDRPPVTP